MAEEFKKGGQSRFEAFQLFMQACVCCFAFLVVLLFGGFWQCVCLMEFRCGPIMSVFGHYLAVHRFLCEADGNIDKAEFTMLRRIEHQRKMSVPWPPPT